MSFTWDIPQPGKATSAAVRENFEQLAVHHRGSTAPPDPYLGFIWLDSSDPNNWKLKAYTQLATSLPTWVVLAKHLESVPLPGTVCYYENRVPGLTDDVSAGFAVGDLWIDLDTRVLWYCTYNAVGAAVWQGLNKDSLRLQVIYVGKHGDDSFDGTTPDDAKLTIGAAITAAGTPVSAAARVVVRVLDAGTYTEDLTAVAFVDIFAPDARVIGSHSLVGNITWSIDYAEAGSPTGLRMDEAGETAFLRFRHLHVNESYGGIFINEGGINLSVDKITMVDAAGWRSNAIFADTTAGESYIHIGRMLLDGDGIGVAVGGGTVTGWVGSIEGGTGTLGLSVHNAEARLVVGKLDCDEALLVNGSTSDLNLTCSEITGTKTWTSGNLRITQAGGFTTTQTLYVGKHGNDNADGRSPEQAFLTITAAMAAAGTPASEAAAVTVEVIDAGEYVEDITAVDYVNISAPNASIKGKLTFAGLTGKASIAARKLGNDSSGTFIANSGSAQLYISAEEIEHAHTDALGAVGGTNVVHLTATRVYHNPGDGIICQGFGTNADLYLDVGEWDMGAAGGGTNGLQASIDGRIYGSIEHMHGGDSGLSLANYDIGGPAEMHLSIGKLDVPAAILVSDDDNIMRLSVREIIGTQSIADGADVRITQVQRNNYTATADPGTNDDSTDGYTAGSWWLRTDTNELFICMANTATAAVWREVAAGGGGSTHVASVDPTVDDDQTQGYDPGEYWLNTADEDLFVCISAATGAARWDVVPTGGKARQQTTDGTLTTVATVTLSDPETAMLDIFVTARRTDSGTDHAAYQRRVAAYRNGGGAFVLGLVDTPLTRETDASWDVTITVAGNDLQVNVQGAAGQTVEWRVRYTLERM